MPGNEDLFFILSKPPPRPLRPVLGSPALVKAAAFFLVACASITAGLTVLWNYLFLHYKEPLFGNERMVAALVVFVLSVASFILFWSLSFIHGYSLYLYRRGHLKTARVEKAYFQEKGGRGSFIINWAIEEGGKVHKGAVSAPAVNTDEFEHEIGKGDTLLLLASGRDPGESMPVGMMGLGRGWTLLPSLAEPLGSKLVRLAVAAWLVLCLGAAAVGFLSSHFVEEKAPKAFVLAATVIGLAAFGLLFASGRRARAWMLPSWTVWGAAVFIATFLAAFGTLKGLNVWMDRTEVRSHNTEVLNLDDSVFPQLHQYAYVRSWRPGRIKEKIPVFWQIPVYWKPGLAFSQGDMVLIDVKDGYFGVPAIVGIRMR